MRNDSHPFFTQVWWKKKKKKQGESSKQTVLENSQGRQDPGWWHNTESVVCFGVWFTGLGPSQVSPSGQEELKQSSPSDKATQILPLWGVTPPLFSAGMLVPLSRAAGPGPGWALGWLPSGPTHFLQLHHVISSSWVHFHLNDQNPNSAKLSVFASSLLLILTAQDWKQISGCSRTPDQPETWKSKRTRSRFHYRPVNPEKDSWIKVDDIHFRIILK